MKTEKTEKKTTKALTPAKARAAALAQLKAYAAILQAERPKIRKNSLAAKPSKTYRTIQVEAKATMNAFAFLGVVTIAEAKEIFDRTYNAGDVYRSITAPEIAEGAERLTAQFKEATGGDRFMEIVR